MDNVTHTLIGVLAGHLLLLRRSAPRDPSARTALVLTAALAGNLPDIDVLLRGFGEDPRLVSLLHHRGYTHTLAGALLEIPLALGLVFGAGRLLRRGPRWRGLETGERREFGLAAAVGLALHILADLGNGYGVHPLSPFWGRWVYGDRIFILEPLLWAALLPFAFRAARVRGARALWSVLGFGLLLVMPARLAPIEIAAYLATLGLAALAQRGGPRPGRAAAAFAVLYLGFVGTGTLARARILADPAVGATAGERIVQLATNPRPTNPLCWNFTAVGARTGEDLYFVRRGALSLAPALWPSGDCELGEGQGEGTAPLVGPLPAGPGIGTIREFRGRLSELRARARGDCRFGALLEFARAPFWTALGDVAGDLRYDREPGLGFTEFELGPELPCPGLVPGWEPPLHELLDQESSGA